MDRYWEANTVSNAPPVPAAGSEGFPADGNPSAGINGTVPGAWWYHSVTEELRNAIEALGSTPDYRQTDQLGGALAATFRQANESLAAPTGAALAGFVQSGSGAVTRNMLVKGRERVSVSDFWVNGDNTKIQAAINRLQPGGVLEFDGGNYTANALTVSVPNIELRLGGGTLTTPGITLKAPGCRIVGQGGTICGMLKVARSTTTTPAGSNVFVFGNGHPFVMGDSLQSSYGLGSDGSKPVPITAIDGNTVTVATAAWRDVPAGAWIGNYAWNATVQIWAPGCQVNEADIVSSQGYAIHCRSADAQVSHVNLHDNGLDLVGVLSSDPAVKPGISFDHVLFGSIYDIAKQGISMASPCDIRVENSTFARRNKDSDFYIYGPHTGTTINVRRTTFDATGNSSVPPPYNVNAWTALNFYADTGSVMDAVDISDHCTFTGYAQGVLMNPSASVASNKPTLNRLRVDSTTRILSSPLGQLDRVTVNDGEIAASVEDDGTGNWWFWSSNSLSSMRFRGARFSGIKTSYGVRLQNNCLVDGCTFTDCPNVQFDPTTRLGSNTLVRSRITDQAGCGEYLISSPVFAGPGDVGAVLNIANNMSVRVRLRDGTLAGYAWRRGAAATYYLELRAVGGDTQIAGLAGDDWFIPVGSVVDCINMQQRIHYTSKALADTLATAVTAGNTVLNLTSVTAAVGDRINLLLDNHAVLSTTISAVNGAAVTLAAAVPSSATAAAGNALCVWAFL